jgi:hypothetical protein
MDAQQRVSPAGHRAEVTSRQEEKTTGSWVRTGEPMNQ